MKDNNSVVLGEGLVSPHTKEDRGTWVGSGGDMTLLLPFPRPSQEVTSPMAGGDLHRSGVSKRQLDTFEFLPITAWGGDRTLYGMQGRASWDCTSLTGCFGVGGEPKMGKGRDQGSCGGDKSGKTGGKKG